MYTLIRFGVSSIAVSKHEPPGVSNLRGCARQIDNFVAVQDIVSLSLFIPTNSSFPRHTIDISSKYLHRLTSSRVQTKGLDLFGIRPCSVFVVN